MMVKSLNLKFKVTLQVGDTFCAVFLVMVNKCTDPPILISLTLAGIISPFHRARMRILTHI